MKKICFAVVVILSLFTLSVAQAADIEGFNITSGLDKWTMTGVTPGEVFFKASFTLYVADANKVVFLASLKDGMGYTFIDDVIVVKVTRPDTTVKYWTYDYSTNCSAARYLAPKDLTSLFQPGYNKVEVTLKDKCGAGVYTTPLWMISQ